MVDIRKIVLIILSIACMAPYYPPVSGPSSQTCPGTDKFSAYDDSTGMYTCSPDSSSGVPADTVQSETSFGIGADSGEGSEYSRGDHTHGTPGMPTAGDVGADPAGSSATVQGNLNTHTTTTQSVHNFDADGNAPAQSHDSTKHLDSYAPSTQGVTNGNTHDHLGGDGGAIAYSSLSGTAILAQIPNNDTAGRCLLSGGTGTAPYYDTCPGGGVDLSGEPFVVSALTTTLTNERALANGTNTTIDTLTAGQIKVNLSGTHADSFHSDSYSGIGSCTNQFVRALNDTAAPTCNGVALATDVTGTLGVSNGGTGIGAAPADDTVLIGNGSAYQSKAVADCSNSTTSKVLYSASTNSFFCGTDQTGGGGSSPSWWNTLQWSIADGNPSVWTEKMSDVLNTVAGPTPTNITVSLARCVKFYQPSSSNMTVNAVRLFAVGATTNLYKFAIYPVGTSTSRLWESGTVTTTANTWLKITASTPFTLNATTAYWWCVTAASTGTTVGFRSRPAPVHSAFYAADARPGGGNTASHAMPSFIQFAVTTGTFPATLPSIAAAAYSGGTTGSVPAALLDNSSTP